MLPRPAEKRKRKPKEVTATTPPATAEYAGHPSSPTMTFKRPKRYATWKDWQCRLATRKKPAPLKKPLAEGYGAGCRQSVGPIERWSPALWNPLIRKAHRLPGLAASLDADEWWAELEQLSELADDAMQRATGCDKLFAGELLVTLGYHFPELGAADRWITRGAAAASHALVELLDGEGLPHASSLARMPEILATAVRLHVMLVACGASLSDRAVGQVGWLVRQAIRFCHGDGRPAFAGEIPPNRYLPLLENAARLVGDDDDRRLLAAATPVKAPALAGRKDNRGGKKAKKASRRGSGRGAAAADVSARYESEWAEAAVLRGSWDRDAPRLFLTYDKQGLQMELGVGGNVWASGRWEPVIRVDGTALEPTDDWAEVCQHADNDGIYYEVERRFTRGVAIQRQIFLAPNDGLLFFADAVFTPNDAADIELSQPTPLTESVEVDLADQTREGELKLGDARLRVIPLGLPEWRQSRGPCSFTAEKSGLRLHMQRQGRRLFAPLLFDLDASRCDKPLTWRPLTVAEQLRILPPDEAVGYRFQMGSKQWLVYRSLAPVGNRTVLGVNLITQFLMARFDKGEVENLIEIE